MIGEKAVTTENSPFNIFESFADIVKKRDTVAAGINGSNSISSSGANVVILMGDKNRGAFEFIVNSVEGLRSFNNGVISVKDIEYSLTYLDEMEDEARGRSNTSQCWFGLTDWPCC